jgi:TPP-dependent pyruvate/acetoin dehydrogenase alpha subunit
MGTIAPAGTGAAAGAAGGPDEPFLSAGLDLRGRWPDRISDLQLLEAMTVLRVFEEKVRDLRMSNDIVGSVHLGIGQEAVSVGALAALRRDDPVFATYRGHGWALASGSSVEALFAELLGRQGGVNGGRGGSAYLSDADCAFYGENSIVGGAVPIACGAALASRFSDGRRVSLTAFGDGAMNQGSVNEAFNFAAAMHLPVVFVCENNRYSELTLITDVVRNEQLFERGIAFGIPSIRIDGNDARAVATAVFEAAERARSGEGPTLIEAMTERLAGHYIGDAEQYRVPGEMDRLRAGEPIVRLRAALPDAGQATSVDARATEAVSEAAERALAQPLADADGVHLHVYAAGSGEPDA